MRKFLLVAAVAVSGAVFAVGGLKPSAAPKNAAIDWEAAETVQTGVKLVRQEKSEPQLMKIYVMRIDMKTPGLKFTGTGKADRFGEPMPDFETRPGWPEKCFIRTKREKTVDYMKRLKDGGYNVIAAWNSGPWYPWPPPKGNEYADPAGLTISDGVEVGDNQPAFPAIFTVEKNGKMSIVESVSKSARKHVQIAHSGFGILMKKGKRLKFEKQSYEGHLMPRSALGYSKDRRYLYVVAIDGRRKGWSDGAFGDDVCDVMEAAGAWEAIDFDGGGSATLCYWDEKTGAPVMVNKNDGRNVGMNMAVYVK